MNINGFEWPEEPLQRSTSAVTRVRPRRPDTVPRVSEDNWEKLAKDRAELIRMLEELLEVECDCDVSHDRRHYAKVLKQIKHGKAVHDFR